MIADISFEQAVFGDEIEVALEAAHPLRRLRWLRCRRGNQAGDVQRLRRQRSGAAGSPEPARPDGHRQPVQPLWRPRPDRHHPVRHLPRRGAGHLRQDLPGRRAGRRRLGVDAATHRSRRGRATGRRRRRPVRPSAGGTARPFVRDDHDLVTEVPISIAQASLGTQIELETLDGTETPRRAAGHPARPRVRAASARRAAPAWPRSRRPAGTCRVDIPTKLDDDEVELLTKYAEGRGEVVGNGKEGLFSRIKSAFS